MIDNTRELAKVRREITDSYLREMWEEKVEPKIQRNVAKGKSRLIIRGFYSPHSTEKLANVGREFGYKVETDQGLFAERIRIYW